MNSGRIENNIYPSDSFNQHESTERHPQAVSRPTTEPLFKARDEYQSPVEQNIIEKPIDQSDVKIGSGEKRTLLQRFGTFLWEAFHSFISIFYSQDYLNKEQGKKELAPLIVVTDGEFNEAKDLKAREKVTPLNQQCMNDWVREGVRVFGKQYKPEDLQNKKLADFNKPLEKLTDAEKAELEKGTNNFKEIKDEICKETNKLMVLWAGRYLNQQALGAFTNALSKLPIGPNGETGWIPKGELGSIQKYEIDKIDGKAGEGNKKSLKLTFEYKNTCKFLTEKRHDVIPRLAKIDDGGFVHVKFSIILHLDDSQYLSDKEFDAKKDDAFYKPTVTVDEIEIFDFKFKNVQLIDAGALEDTGM